MGREARRNRSNRSEYASPASPEAGPISVTVRSKSPWGKLSEKLRSVAEPWTSRLDDDPPESTIKTIYTMASTIWNTSRLPDPAEQSAALREVRQLMAATLPDLPATAVQELLDEMYARAHQRHGDDPRIIVEVSVERRGDGGLHVAVASIDET